MASTRAPLIDGDNPCYCPSIPPSVYLTMLRQALQSSSNPFHHFPVHSFFWKLGTGVFKEGIQKPEETVQDMASSSPLPSSPLASIRPPMIERNQYPNDKTTAPVPSRLVGPAMHFATLKRAIPLAHTHTVIKRRRYSSADPAASSGDQDHWKPLSFDKNLGEFWAFSTDRRALDAVQLGTTQQIHLLLMLPFSIYPDPRQFI